MIRSFDGEKPVIADTAHVDKTAVLIGDVTVESDASVWPGAVLRGDHGPIVLREGANVQDNVTLHETVEIGPYSTVGHNAIVHDATVGSGSIVGMAAVVLDDSEIGSGSIVAANSVVTEDTAVPDSVLVAGAPAKVVKELEDAPGGETAERYVALAGEHAETSSVIDRDSR